MRTLAAMDWEWLHTKYLSALKKNQLPVERFLRPLLICFVEFKNLFEKFGFFVPKGEVTGASLFDPECIGSWTHLVYLSPTKDHLPHHGIIACLFS